MWRPFFSHPFFPISLCHFPIIRCSNMNLTSEIIRCHSKGLTRIETFQLLCASKDLPLVPVDLSAQWFKELKESSKPDLDHYFPYYELLHEVFLVFGNIKNTISTWPN